MIAISVLPFVLLFLSTAFWSIVACIRKRKDYLKRELVTTWITVMFLIHPNVVKTTIALLSCTEIDTNEWWLTDEQNIRCWDDEHIWFVTRISLPALLIWGLGIPCISFVFLFKNRKNLLSEESQLKYGYLFMGYKRSRYYWEFVIVYRKILIAIVSVF